MLLFHLSIVRTKAKDPELSTSEAKAIEEEEVYFGTAASTTVLGSSEI